MADTAAHLVDRVLPRVPVRQWVLSLPRPIRYILARDSKLLSGVLTIFVSEIFKDLRRRAGIRRTREGLSGAVTAIQRFGGALNLNIHFHTLVLDGLYVRDGSTGSLQFHRLPAPSRDDLDRIVSRVRFRILKFLTRKGYAVGIADAPRTESVEDPSLLDAVQGASIRERIGLAQDGRPVQVLGRESEVALLSAEKLSCVGSGDGFNLDAGVRIRAGDRKGLEQLCKYVLRPLLAEERLTLLPDGRVLYKFRRARFDGGTHLILTPIELLEKLAALVPPPRSHLVCYHGVLAPHARSRVTVCPPCPSPEKGVGPTRPEEAKRPEIAGCGHDRRGSKCGEEGGSKPVSRTTHRRGRTPWAELLLRSMALDVLACPKCSGRMAVIACIREPEVARKILRAMGLPAEAPRPAPARPPPQLRFDFVQDSSVE